MGQGIAQIAAAAGLEVRLMDVDAPASARAVTAIGAVLDKLAEKGKLTSEQAQAALRRIQPEDSVGGLADCDSRYPAGAIVARWLSGGREFS
jgi:3-hydroxybutyryl-CoA dehydrogenase